MERLDGKEKWSVVESPRERRSIQTVVLNEAVFVQYLDAGAWHLAFYNDGREREIVSFSTNVMGKSDEGLWFVGVEVEASGKMKRDVIQASQRELRDSTANFYIAFKQECESVDTK